MPPNPTGLWWQYLGENLMEREGGDLFERDRIKPQALAAIAVVYAQMGQAETMRQLLQQVNQLDVIAVAKAIRTLAKY